MLNRNPGAQTRKTPRRVDRKQIVALSERIAQEFRPNRIMLFGSYAYGNPTPNSDVDLLVIMPFEGHPALKATEIHLATAPSFPVDIIVRTPQMIRQRLHVGDPFIADILRQGELLYEARHRRMGGQSRRRFRRNGKGNARTQQTKL